jgi:hypothetical protein
MMNDGFFYTIGDKTYIYSKKVWIGVSEKIKCIRPYQVSYFKRPSFPKARFPCYDLT